jgi:hypothetical protein
MKLCKRCGDLRVRINSSVVGCKRCWRFRYMRICATKYNKVVPSIDALDEMEASLVRFQCPHCSRQMNWLAREGESTVVTLQHYRDGRMGLICRACNTKHAKMPEQVFLSLRDGQKWCPACKTVKALSGFYASAHTKEKVTSVCKPCCHMKRRELNQNNAAFRERQRLYQKALRNKKKEMVPCD